MIQSFFDQVDDTDTLVNNVASYDEVHSQGLWHRGVHVIIYTPDKHIVMQKRAPSLKYHPNEIEVSVGGGVDAGESPEQAAVREIYEELGITIPESSLRFIGKTKFNHHTKTQHNRVFIYSYAICLERDALKLQINEEESTLAFFISAKRLRRALRMHRIKNIGRISSQYAYWRYLLDAI
jgi:8-oxo-dGTP pyrophosphatase MutT (NUDIX family)